MMPTTMRLMLRKEDLLIDGYKIQLGNWKKLPESGDELNNILLKSRIDDFILILEHRIEPPSVPDTPRPTLALEKKVSFSEFMGGAEAIYEEPKEIKKQSSPMKMINIISSRIINFLPLYQQKL